MEEAMELVYRIQADHCGSLSRARRTRSAPGCPPLSRGAERLSWLVSNGDPPVLKVTYGGRKALDAALASREAAVPKPHWFGGSIVPVSSETGPVLPALSYEPYEELKSWALEQGILTQEDLDRIARSPRQKPKEPEEYRTLDELSFPGTRGFAASQQYEDSHPFGGGFLDPTGHEGAYQVTATLTRRGAPDVSFAYVTDAYMMEDSEQNFAKPVSESLWEAVGTWYVRHNATAHYGAFVVEDARQQSRGWYRRALKSHNALVQYGGVDYYPFNLRKAAAAVLRWELYAAAQHSDS